MSTPDVSNVDQLTCVIRYVLPSGPVERFVHFLPMMKHTGLELATRLLTFLDQHGIDIKKCRGQSYDNASNMSGKYNGMQAIILEKCQFAAFIPCAAHSLNLVGKCAAECCPGAVSFFDFMNQLYTYFSASTHRWRVLKEALGPGGLVVQKLSTTRWSARVDAAVALAKGYDAILAALCEIANDVDQTANARVEARGLRDRMDQLETAILTEVWFEILSQFNKISITLQTAGIALNTAVGLLKGLIDFVQQIRDQFDRFEACGVERVGHEEYTAEKKRVRKRNVQWDFGTGEEAVLEPRGTLSGRDFYFYHGQHTGRTAASAECLRSHLRQLQLPQQPQHVFKW